MALFVKALRLGPAVKTQVTNRAGGCRRHTSTHQHPRRKARPKQSLPWSGEPSPLILNPIPLKKITSCMPAIHVPIAGGATTPSPCGVPCSKRLATVLRAVTAICILSRTNGVPPLPAGKMYQRRSSRGFRSYSKTCAAPRRSTCCYPQTTSTGSCSRREVWRNYPSTTRSS